MKKILIAFAALTTIILVAAFTLPVIFKDDIQKAIDDQIDENINASVYYNANDFDLSLFPNFPDLTLSIGDFGVVGIDDFEGDTLAAINSFELTIDIASLFGDQISIVSVLLDQPKINVIVLPDGTANYDIAVESEEVAEVEKEVSNEEEVEESSDLSIAIESWELRNANINYDDQAGNMLVSIEELNHSGSGDFTKSVFDLSSETSISKLDFMYDDVAYLSNKQVFADITLSMDLDQMRFSFLENRLALNDFEMQLDGFLQMPSDDIEMDIDFGGKDIKLESILSLIPGIYQEYLEDLDASGEIDFTGSIAGVYSDTTMPAVAANLKVRDGQIEYVDYPVPIEKILVDASFSYPSADLTESSFDVNQFQFEVAEEIFSAFAHIKDFENPMWDIGADGRLDLAKLTSIIPVEGMELEGLLSTNFTSKGSLDLVEEEKYDQIMAEGMLSVSSFSFLSDDLSSPFEISQAKMDFSPSQITLEKFESSLGTSDFNLNGGIQNFIGFALRENEILQGNLNFTSSITDLNELMVSDTTAQEIDTLDQEGALEVVEIPGNIQFELNASIGKLLYDNLALEKFQGKVLVQDQAIILKNNSFQLLNGAFALSGKYSTKNSTKPSYSFSFGIQDLSIGRAFDSFETIKKFVPVAEQVSGDFSTDFNVNGILGTDMMPLMETINLDGLVKIAEASLNEGNFVNKLSALNSLKPLLGRSAENAALVSLKDVTIKASIKNGTLYIDPFDLKVAGQTATLAGQNSLSGDLDYSMLVKDVSTGAIGQTVNKALGALLGNTNVIAEKVDLNFGVSGTAKDPKISLLNTSRSGNSNSTAASSFKAKVDEQKAKAEEEIKKQKEKLEAEAKAELEKQRKKAADSLKAVQEAKKKKLEEEAKKKLKGMFKKGGG